MANVLHENKQDWSRWMPIVMTSPSGKVLFVCVVCGTISPGPTKECRVKDALVGRRSLESDETLQRRASGVRTCSEVERHINLSIANHRPDHLQLDIEENKLRSHRNKYCDTCRGYGCQVCLGKGRQW